MCMKGFWTIGVIINKYQLNNLKICEWNVLYVLGLARWTLKGPLVIPFLFRKCMVGFAAKRKNRFPISFAPEKCENFRFFPKHPFNLFREKIQNKKNWSKKTKYRCNTYSFREIFREKDLIRFIRFREKVCKYAQKSSHFFTKLFVRCKP